MATVAKKMPEVAGVRVNAPVHCLVVVGAGLVVVVRVEVTVVTPHGSKPMHVGVRDELLQLLMR